VNLTNATLVSLAPATTNAAGRTTFGAATTLNARCVLDDVTRAQQIALGAKLGNASAVLYVLKSELPAGTTPDRGQQAIAVVDGAAAATYRIAFVRNREKEGGLSHWECFLEIPGGGA
jgi:hypothetical protein